jgi:DNA-binding Xre family transcriptional regulator
MSSNDAQNGMSDAAFVAKLKDLKALRELGDIFAEAFAKYTVRVMELTSKGRSTEDSSTTPGPTIPDWVAEEIEKVEQNPLSAVPGDAIRAKVARDFLLRSLREKKMTQADLARKLRKKANSISRIFAQPERSRLETLWEIADAIGVDLSDILRGHSQAGLLPHSPLKT